jgi:hypothetical protein
MPIYQHETVEVVPGQLREYFDGLERLYLPMSGDRRLHLVGFFQTSGNSGRWPEAVAIWEVDDWETHVWQRKTAGSHAGLHQYMKDALGWRTGGFDRILIPVSFSPRPPRRPEVRSPGAVCMQQTFLVRPTQARGFLDAVQKEIVPRAAEGELTLQAFWRSTFRPLEYLALWSMPDWDAYGRVLARRDPEDEGSNMPGLGSAFEHLTDLEEKILIPASFSPLGGAERSSVYTV